MVLYDEKDLREERNKRAKALLLLLIVALIIFTTNITYNELKGLPTITECKEINYPYGEKNKEYGIVCYDDCSTKQLDSCKKIKVIK